MISEQAAPAAFRSVPGFTGVPAPAPADPPPKPADSQSPFPHALHSAILNAFTRGEPLHRIITRLRLTNEQLDAFLRTPGIPERLTSLRALARFGEELLGSQARLQATAFLQDYLNSADSEIEKRRAAVAILRGPAKVPLSPKAHDICDWLLGRDEPDDADADDHYIPCDPADADHCPDPGKVSDRIASSRSQAAERQCPPPGPSAVMRPAASCPPGQSRASPPSEVGPVEPPAPHAPDNQTARIHEPSNRAPEASTGPAPAPAPAPAPRAAPGPPVPARSPHDADTS